MDTLQAVPRYLVHCIEQDGSRFYFSPEAAVRGDMYRRSPGEIKRIMRGTAAYKKWQKREYDEGRSYEPSFPWPDELLDLEPSEIPDLLRENVRKKDSSYILFDARPGRVFEEVSITGNEIDGHVKSKGKRRRTRPNYHICSFQNAFLDEYHYPDLRHMKCNCDDHSIDYVKPADFHHFYMDVHLSALMAELQERTDTLSDLNPPGRVHFDGESGGAAVFSPYSFTSNWTYNNGRLEPVNKHLAALEGDVLLTYYSMNDENDDCFGINERLFGIWEIYSRHMMEWMRNGLVTRRVLTQRREKMNGDTMPRFGHQLRSFFAKLKDYGYVMDGHCRELGGIATRYLNRETGNSVSIMSSEGLPFYVVREPVPGYEIDPFFQHEDSSDPFEFMGRRERDVTHDDVTMKRTRRSVMPLSVFKVPESGFETLDLDQSGRKAYRDNMRKANNGENVSKEKRVWVHY